MIPGRSINNLFTTTKNSLENIVSYKIQLGYMDEIDIEIYETANGKRPFESWIKEIKDPY